MASTATTQSGSTWVATSVWSAILRGDLAGSAFRAVAAGGDFVLPGGEWQPLHNDLAWKGAGEEVPRLLIVNYYVSDVRAASGPIRMVPGTARFPVPPHRVIGKHEPAWMKQSVATGQAWLCGHPRSAGLARRHPEHVE